MQDTYAGFSRSPQNNGDVNRAVMMALFARLDNVAAAAALGTVFGLGLFIATAVLLLKGAPAGTSIGPNLSALITFLPGFGMNWLGAAAGAMYGFVLGTGIGCVIAFFWNLSHLLFVGTAVLRGDWLG